MPKLKSPRVKKPVSIDSYSHRGKKRKNNPHVGLVSSATDKLNGRTKYQHDPHIDPYLSWAGKQEGTSFEVQNVSLHIHERIDPQRIVQSFLRPKDKKSGQLLLFETPDSNPPLVKAVDFYHHDQDWANRLIAGDSLLVMNSLLKKEGMAGKVQMIYIDPPYGIKYNSNFQPFVNKRDVKDGNDADIPAEPEMIQAFRDTWEIGIHSYLTYLRERLLLARELLHESGSCFVQISDENVHHVMEIMDEVFGKENYVVIFPIKKKGSQKSSLLDPVNDFLIWYSKSARTSNKVKYKQLYVKRPFDAENLEGFRFVEIDGVEYELKDLKTPKGTFFDYFGNPKKIIEDFPSARLFRPDPLQSGGVRKNQSLPFDFKGRTYKPKEGSCWKTTVTTDDGKKPGMIMLAEKNRLIAVGNGLYYKRVFADFEYKELSNWWDNLGGASNQIYVVQTNEEILKRCILMTTDPGDLVLDPTCGSGTTAYVAEQWGRRWITCDTSRVAITLAKQRLMTAKFDYFELAHPNEGIKSGFKYKTVPHITLGSIANNEPAKEETLYDQPFVEREKVRVTGPFTVEAVPSLRVKPFDGSMPKVQIKSDELARMGETGRQSEWRDELKSVGIRATGGKVIQFSRIEPMAATRFLHAEGEILEESGENKQAYVSFGPDYGPLEQRQVEEAIKEARSLKSKPDFVVFAAFHFDPECAKDIDEINWPGVKILKAQMSVDLLTKDLRKNRSSSHSYWLIGQPDVEVVKLKGGQYKIKVHGFDYYNPVTGEIESKGTKQIAMWFLDTDYDERSLYPDQVFFPESDPKRDWSRLAKALNGEVNEELLEKFSGVESRPFSGGDNKKIAVKIIDNRGIESFVIKKLE